jgi:hypothetical protein
MQRVADPEVSQIIVIVAEPVSTACTPFTAPPSIEAVTVRIVVSAVAGQECGQDWSSRPPQEVSAKRTINSGKPK